MRISDWSSDVCSSDLAAVGRTAFDLLDRQFGALRRHDDRGAQARFAIEPLARHPVVHGPRETGRHVLSEEKRMPVSLSPADIFKHPLYPRELGRASCMERVFPYV